MRVDSSEEFDLIVVDSDEVAYEDLGSALTEAGLQWVHARNGHHSLRTTMSRPARLWLANMRLPDMSGVELMDLVKTTRPGTPFYLLSDVYSIDDEKTARAAGAAAYFTKPAERLWADFFSATLASLAVRAGPAPYVQRTPSHPTLTSRSNPKPHS